MLLGQDLQATASSPRKGRRGPLDYIIPPMKRPPLAGWLRHAVRSAWSWITHAVRSAWSWINAVPAWSWITIWVVLVVIAVSVISIMCWDWLSSESNGSTIRNIVLGAAAIIALPLAIWRSKVAERQAATAQRQSETAQRGLLNERHRKGVDMLGSEKLTVRLGGIYALAWLAREYPGDYHTQIMRLFCVFVREASEARVRKDVRAVMTAVGMRSSSQIETEKKEMGYPLDSGSPKALWFGRSIDASTLHPECIQGCQTPVWTRSDHGLRFGADQGSRTRHGHRRLGNVVLSASLSGSRQWPTTVCCGHLSQMDTPQKEKYRLGLFGANLEGLCLSSVNLTRVRLDGANLSGANLLNTNLSGAFLDKANLSEALLHGTDLRDCQGLTQEQLGQALTSKEHPPNLEGVVDDETGNPLVCP